MLFIRKQSRTGAIGEDGPNHECIGVLRYRSLFCLTILTSPIRPAAPRLRHDHHPISPTLFTLMVYSTSSATAVIPSPLFFVILFYLLGTDFLQMACILR